MPPPLPPGVVSGQSAVSADDPRAQLPPYRYDLYGVTNHFGTLSSGHCESFCLFGSFMFCVDMVAWQIRPLFHLVEAGCIVTTAGSPRRTPKTSW